MAVFDELVNDPTLNDNARMRAKLRRLFRDEANAVANLRHDNVVSIFDYGDHEGSPYLVMDYIDGRTVYQVIQSKQMMQQSRRLQLIEDLCAGLGYAHRHKLVHRDIKPANLIIDGSTGSLKILDFGVVRRLGSASTVGVPVGTFCYMSPEQTRGAATLDHRSDIFAVGLVFYELLSGKKAFPPGKSIGDLVARIQRDPPPSLLELVPSVPKAIDEIISKALQKLPENRYQELALMEREIAKIRSRMEAAEQSEGTSVTADTNATIVKPRPAQLSIAGLLADAERVLASGDVDAALELTRKILTIQPGFEPAQNLVQRIETQKREGRVRGSLQQAEKFLALEELTSAHRALAAAREADPASPLIKVFEPKLEAATAKRAAATAQREHEQREVQLRRQRELEQREQQQREQEKRDKEKREKERREREEREREQREEQLRRQRELELREQQQREKRSGTRSNGRRNAGNGKSASAVNAKNWRGRNASDSSRRRNSAKSARRSSAKSGRRRNAKSASCERKRSCERRKSSERKKNANARSVNCGRKKNASARNARSARKKSATARNARSARKKSATARNASCGRKKSATARNARSVRTSCASSRRPSASGGREKKNNARRKNNERKTSATARSVSCGRKKSATARNARSARTSCANSRRPSRKSGSVRPGPRRSGRARSTPSSSASARSRNASSASEARQRALRDLARPLPGEASPDEPTAVTMQLPRDAYPAADGDLASRIEPAESSKTAKPPPPRPGPAAAPVPPPPPVAPPAAATSAAAPTLVAQPPVPGAPPKAPPGTQSAGPSRKSKRYSAGPSKLGIPVAVPASIAQAASSSAARHAATAPEPAKPLDRGAAVPPKPPVPPTATTRSGVSPMTLGIAIGVVLLLAILAGLAYVMQSSDPTPPPQPQPQRRRRTRSRRR